MAENSAAGTAVGDPVTGTPYDDGDDQTDDALTYTLTGEAATSNAFTIDSATGQISVKQGATIDFETKSSYTGKVHWTVQEQQATADVTITVTDLEAGQPATRRRSRARRIQRADEPGAGRDLDGADANGTDHHRLQRAVPQAGRRRPDTPNAWTTYTYTDANENVTSALAVSTTSLTLPDLEAGATYEVQVRARHQRWRARAPGRTPGRAGPTGRRGVRKRPTSSPAIPFCGAEPTPSGPSMTSSRTTTATR